MPIRKSQQLAVTKYKREHYDIIRTQVSKDERIPQRIDEARQKHSQSRSAYVLEAIKQRLDADGINQVDE